MSRAGGSAVISADSAACSSYAVARLLGAVQAQSSLSSVLTHFDNVTGRTATYYGSAVLPWRQVPPGEGGRWAAMPPVVVAILTFLLLLLEGTKNHTGSIASTMLKQGPLCLRSEIVCTMDTVWGTLTSILICERNPAYAVNRVPLCFTEQCRLMMSASSWHPIRVPNAQLVAHFIKQA